MYPLLSSWRTWRPPLVLLSLLGLLSGLAACSGAASPSAAQRTVPPNVSTTRPTVFTTNQHEVLSALDAHTGQPFWQTPSTLPVKGPPAFAASEQLVYVAGLTPDTPLLAFDARTGQPIWRTPIPHGDPSSADPPVIDGAHRLVYTTASNVLVALQAQTGRVVWTKTAPSLTFFDVVLVADQAVIVVVRTADWSILQALVPQTGHLIWAYETPDQADFGQEAAFNATQGLLYVVAHNPTNDRLLAIKVQTGALLWQFHPGPPLGLPVAAPESFVFVQATTQGQLFALNAQSGALLWQAATGPGAEASAPRVAGNSVYVGTLPSTQAATDGGVWAFSANRGQVLWHVAGTTEVLATPGVGQGLVCIPFVEDDRLHALSASTGVTLWTLPEVDRFTTPVLVAVSLVSAP